MVDVAQYNKDYDAAKIDVAIAERKIDKVRENKIFAITGVVLAVLALVGILILAAVTHTWPLLFIAVPCAAVLVPSSYYTHIMSKILTTLEKGIAAPEAIQKPVLNSPIYDPKKDFGTPRQSHRAAECYGFAIE